MTAKKFLKQMFAGTAIPNETAMISAMEAYRDHCRDEWIKEINQIAMVQASYSDDVIDGEKYLHGEYVASLCATVLSDE